MASNTSADTKKVRDFAFNLDQLPETYSAKIAVPSIGIDFGSYHVRVAIVNKSDEQKYSVHLATFTSDLDAALQHAKQHLSKHNGVNVFYTGRATDCHVEAIKAAFPEASKVSRRDKLDSHNAGASFLLQSSLPEETLFHDTSALDQKFSKPSLDPTVMAAMFPPKMMQMMGMFIQEVMASSAKKFPAILSIVGANNIICQIDESGSYKTAIASSVGGNSLNTLWNLMGHPGHTDNFEHLMELASKGERRKIDGVTNEILDFVGFYALMPRDFPVFTFGKMEKQQRDQVTPEDLARALTAHTTDILYGKVFDAAKLTKTYKIYFTGNLIQYDSVRNELTERSYAWGGMGLVKSKFFKTDATAALGACIDTTA